jgi:hypothetical protein
MRSKATILAIVGGAVVLAAAVLVGMVVVLGAVRGLAVAVGTAAVVLLVYRLAVQPWQHRWGATEDEVDRPMPGDDLIPGARSTTRAISVAAPTDTVWPWLVQIGYDRAGWYSYDWIDNDGRPSADRIVPELQDLQVGDQILMVPGMGPLVRDLEPGSWLLAGDRDGGTWCLALYPDGEGRTRLVSRWRQAWRLTPASAFWILIADPGAFVMERRMLRGIRDRAEAGVDDDRTRIGA